MKPCTAREVCDAEYQQTLTESVFQLLADLGFGTLLGVGLGCAAVIAVMHRFPF